MRGVHHTGVDSSFGTTYLFLPVTESASSMFTVSSKFHSFRYPPKYIYLIQKKTKTFELGQIMS